MDDDKHAAVGQMIFPTKVRRQRRRERKIEEGGGMGKLGQGS